MTVLDLAPPQPPPAAPPVDLAQAAGQVLDQLGDTVAAQLLARRIRGVRCDPAGCPIALLLRTELPTLTGVRVSSVSIELFTADERVELDCPAQVALFVEDYDCGHHPALETAA